MPIETEMKDGSCFCRLSGALCVWEAAGIWRGLQALLESPQPLTVNLSGVTECDSAGIQILCQIEQSARSCGKPILMTDFPESVRRTLEQAGLDAASIAAWEGGA